jgi:hypothetical protein
VRFFSVSTTEKKRLKGQRHENIEAKRLRRWSSQAFRKRHSPAASRTCRNAGNSVLTAEGTTSKGTGSISCGEVEFCIFYRLNLRTLRTKDVEQIATTCEAGTEFLLLITWNLYLGNSCTYFDTISWEVCDLFSESGQLTARPENFETVIVYVFTTHRVQTVQQYAVIRSVNYGWVCNFVHSNDILFNIFKVGGT